MKKFPTISASLLPLLAVCILLLGSCKAVEKAVERGIRQAGISLQEEEAALENLTANLSETAVRSALLTLSDDSLQQLLRTQLQGTLDSLLGQTSDSLDRAAHDLVANLLGQQTDSLLNARFNDLAAALTNGYRQLEPEIRDGFRALVINDLSEGLKELFLTLRDELNSAETYASLEGLRHELTRQVDSLLRSSINATSRYTDVMLIPKVDDLAQRVEVIGSDTEARASNLIWLIVLGGAALLLLGGMIRFYLQQQKYREMVKVITANIDDIEQQSTYDRLVGRISADMRDRDLEDNLREILEEQDLIIQPKWESKDYQVTRLLLKQIKDSAESEAVDRETWSKALFARAKELGLEDHLQSMMTRDNTEE